MTHKQVIAHRGASAYAPENTMPSFELGLKQEAGCIEHDLQVTRDGALICLHDPTLERTTDVQARFPGRGRIIHENGQTTRRWFAHDLTLAEIRQLDAGSWFDRKFAGAKIPTYDELLEWSLDRVAVLTEIKDVELYESLGIDPLLLCRESLRRHGHASRLSVTVQSFHAPTVRRAAQLFEAQVPVALLVEPADAALLADRDRVAAVAGFANGIGPGKAIIENQPQVVVWAHEVGLRMTPWTFRAATAGRFGTLAAELEHYLRELHVDAVITDHPDQAVSVL